MLRIQLIVITSIPYDAYREKYKPFIHLYRVSIYYRFVEANFAKGFICTTYMVVLCFCILEVLDLRVCNDFSGTCVITMITRLFQHTV